MRQIRSALVIAAVGVALGCHLEKHGAETMGTFTCTEIEQQSCVDATDQFATTVDVVHLLYKTKDMPKRGDVYVIQWIAEDVGAAAPKNTEIATINEQVDDDVGSATFYVVKSHLTKPTNGWPAGKYRAEVKLDDKLLTTARFSLEERE